MDASTRLLALKKFRAETLLLNWKSSRVIMAFNKARKYPKWNGEAGS